jgi:hypothetical protein
MIILTAASSQKRQGQALEIKINTAVILTKVFRNPLGCEVAGTWFDAERDEWRVSTVAVRGFNSEREAIEFYHSNCDHDTGILSMRYRGTLAHAGGRHHDLRRLLSPEERVSPWGEKCRRRVMPGTRRALEDSRLKIMIAAQTLYKTAGSETKLVDAVGLHGWRLLEVEGLLPNGTRFKNLHDGDGSSRT